MPARAALLAMALTACGISTDATPRDVGAAVRQDNNAADNGQTGITATSTSVIYLVGHDDTGRFVLRPAARDVTETIDNALQALFSGPTPRELNDDLRTAIPSRTRLVSATPNNDVVTIDVTDPLAELTGSTLVDAIGQIVLTATDVTGVNGVVITVATVVHPWPTAGGELTTDPLTRADFSVLLPNSGVKATDPTVPETPPAGESTAVTTSIAAVLPPAVPPAPNPPPTAAPRVGDTVAPDTLSPSEP
jgi:Sporulation and spore germination